MRLSVNKMVATSTVLAMMISSTASLPVFAESSTVITKNYIKYDIGTNTTTPYSLSIDVSYSDQTRGIIGTTDNRVRDGHNGIVLFGDSTGFIVDDHVIAVAAHSAYLKFSLNTDLSAAHADSKYFYNDVSIFLYTNSGTMESGFQLTPVEIHVPDEYVNPVGNSDDFSVDYALVTVEEDLSEYTHFNLGVPYDMDSPDFLDIDLFVTGIPYENPDEDLEDDVKPTVNYLKQVYTGKGKIYTPENAVDDVVYYTCDISGGNSGGPIYTAYQYTSGSEVNTVYTAIGIVGGDNPDFSVPGVIGSDGNRGAAMTPSTIQFYLNNPNLSH